jgi:hypothetical protein
MYRGYLESQLILIISSWWALKRRGGLAVVVDARGGTRCQPIQSGPAFENWRWKSRYTKMREKSFIVKCLDW